MAPVTILDIHRILHVTPETHSLRLAMAELTETIVPSQDLTLRTAAARIERPHGTNMKMSTIHDPSPPQANTRQLRQWKATVPSSSVESTPGFHSERLNCDLRAEWCINLLHR